MTSSFVMHDNVEVEEVEQLVHIEAETSSKTPTLDRVSKFLGDLGKPTQRGVKRCEKCGTENGTRGLKCKNANCDQIFKTSETRKPYGPEAVKLHTDPSIQIYSVRTKTGDARGFVQLPIVQDMDGNPAVVDVGIVCSAAKCYVETCGRSRNDALEPCFHIKSSVEALEDCKILTILKSSLEELVIPDFMRDQIWEFVTDGHGPVVQRVTKNMMAVRTAVSNRHPVGYLHFTFLSSKKEEKRFVCTCREAKTVKVSISENGAECTYKIQRCVHFYACLAAFASDPALSKEFRFALDADNEEKSLSALDRIAVENSDFISENVAAVASVTDSLTAGVDLTAQLTGSHNTDAPASLHDDESMEVIITSAGSETSPLESRACHMTRTTGMTAAVAGVNPSSHTSSILPAKRLRTADSSPVPISSRLIQPQTTQQTFNQWLNAVTEQINLTMHFQLPGNPKPLVFHIPQAYWECLQQRISLSTINKRRLPDHTSAVRRTRSPPLGTFTMFSWYLTELAHVRKVFDTPEVALLVSKYFDKCKDGSYKLSSTPRVQVDTFSECYEPKLPSKRHEYKTLLRVGAHGNQGTVPFVIDWIPDIFPLTHTGELSLTFQYSHLIDGLAPAVQDDLVKQVIESGS